MSKRVRIIVSYKDANAAEIMSFSFFLFYASERKHDCEVRSFSLLAGNGNLSIHHLRKAFGNRQSQARSAIYLTYIGVFLLKSLKYFIEILGRDTASGINYFKFKEEVRIIRVRSRNAQSDFSTSRCKFQRV